MYSDDYKIYCDEGENFYKISYNLNNNDVEVKIQNNSRVFKEYFESIINVTENSLITTLVCAKSETRALEKAARVFREHFERIAREAPNAIYQELDKRENCWYAKFIPTAKLLKLTCISEVPTGYSSNLVFVEEEGGYPKFFAFIKAKEYDAAWENAFTLFRDYINDCNDTLDYIDNENCTRASRKE